MSISSANVHSMDMGLKSTGFLNPSEIEIVNHDTIECGYPLVDELLGNIVPGSVFSVTGTPGAGKTTLLLNILSAFSTNENIPVAYISCEETVSDLKRKTDRLAIDNVALCNEAELEIVVEHILSAQHQVLVVDSLHGMHSSIVDKPTLFIKYAGNRLIQAAKEAGTTLFIICHANKQGEVNGGNKFPHAVDCDLRLQLAPVYGTKARRIFTAKNRLGGTDELFVNMYGTGYNFNEEAVYVEEDLSPAEMAKLCTEERYKVLLLTSINHYDNHFTVEHLEHVCESFDLELPLARRLMNQLVRDCELYKSGSTRANMVWSA